MGLLNNLLIVPLNRMLLTILNLRANLIRSVFLVLLLFSFYLQCVKQLLFTLAEMMPWN